MLPDRASRRYFMIFVPAMFIYMAASFAFRGILNDPEISKVVRFTLASVPTLALLSMFWAHWRFINDVDEFLRRIQIKAVLGGLIVVMVIASGWGSLENLIDAPAFKVFWLNPIFWASYGATAGYFTWRDGGVF